jgi:hypothetical protein
MNPERNIESMAPVEVSRKILVPWEWEISKPASIDGSRGERDERGSMFAKRIPMSRRTGKVCARKLRADDEAISDGEAISDNASLDVNLLVV